jgi:hypothetical protein
MMGIITVGQRYPLSPYYLPRRISTLAKLYNARKKTW